MENNRVKEVRDFVQSLYVPGYAFDQHRFLMKWLQPQSLRLRGIVPDDSWTAHLNLLVIETVGKGVARSFKRYRILKADFARIGKKFADCYLYEDGELGTPCRIDITSAKYSIIID